MNELDNAHIPEYLQPYCYVCDGIIYTPQYDSQCNMTMTGEEFYNKREQIDICPPKTLEQRLEEAEQKLAESEEEKKLLKAQVEVLSNTTDFHEELIAEMASKVYA